MSRTIFFFLRHAKKEDQKNKTKKKSFRREKNCNFLLLIDAINLPQNVFGLYYNEKCNSNFRLFEREFFLFRNCQKIFCVPLICLK